MHRLITRWIVLFALFAVPVTALAGGWSVVTLDRTPADLQAGVPFTIGFVVLQHGKTPMEGLSPKITLIKQDAADAPNSVVPASTARKGEERIVVTATPEGQIGHYVATITLPSSGAWSWEIDAYGPVAKLSPLAVNAAPAKVAPDQTTSNAPIIAAPSSTLARWLAGTTIAVGAIAAALMVAWQRRRVGTPS